MKNCDMCGVKIKEGECNCGNWLSKEESECCPFRKALEKFNSMEQMIITGDAPHLGCAVVFFRGDIRDCKEVEKFILKMKGRPFYKDE